MKTKTISVYAFDELSGEAKQKALEHFSEINLYDGWEECEIDNFVEDVKAQTGLIIEKKEVNWQLLSRTDEVSVSSSHIVAALQEKHPKLEDFALPKKFGVYCAYMGGGLNSAPRGSDYDKDHIVMTQDYDDEDALESDVEAVQNDALKNAILQDLDALQTLMKKLYGDIYNNYMDSISEETIAETIRINEYEFDENGKVI